MRDEPFLHEKRTAIDEPRQLCTVLGGARRDGVVVGFVGLTEVRSVAVRVRALVFHPGDRRRRVEAAGKRDADALAEGKGEENLAVHRLRPEHFIRGQLDAHTNGGVNGRNAGKSLRDRKT